MFQLALCLSHSQERQLQLQDLLGCARLELSVLLGHPFLFPALQVGAESIFPHKFVGLGFCTCVLFPLVPRSTGNPSLVLALLLLSPTAAPASAPCSRLVLCQPRAGSSVGPLRGRVLLHGRLHHPKPQGWSRRKRLSPRPFLSCRELFPISVSPRWVWWQLVPAGISLPRAQLRLC